MLKRKEPGEDCAMCDDVLAVVGLFAGLLIVAFAVDLLAGNRLSDRIDGLFSSKESETADE